MSKPGGQKEADGARKGVLDINEQIVQTNALLVETLGKLTRAESVIQSLEQEKEELVDTNKELRKQNSRECNTLTKENADLEKERHRLRDRIEELENEIDGLKEIVKELQEKCSATDAIYSGSDEAGERDETLMKTAARNFVWKPRRNRVSEIIFCCIEISEKSGYAYGFIHDLETKDRMKKIEVPAWYCPGALSDKTPTAVLLDQSMQLIDFGLMAEHRYVEMLEEECVDCFLFRLRRTRNEKILQMGLKLSDERNLKSVSVVQFYQHVIQFIKDRVMEKFTKHNFGIEMRDIMWILIVPAELGNQEINLMEEAAMQAGLPWDQLATLYAPIASIVHAENMDDEYRKCLNVLGKNIAVVDVKDTVHITVYQRGRNGALREITAVNNLPCGEASFHAAFENLIVEIVGSRVWSKFRQTSDYLDFTRGWKSLERTRASNGRFKGIKLPCTLMDLFQECTHSCLSDAIKATKYTDLLKMTAGYLRIDSDFLIQLFQPSLDTLTSNIHTVLENKTVSNDTVILLVGDFAECDVVQDTIKQVFSGNRVIVPNECGLSALIGGVLYGHMYE